MKILRRNASATVLASTILLLAGCGQDAPTVPASSANSAGRATAGSVDSTAGVAGATSDAITATVSTISMQQGDYVTVTVTSNECSGNPETVNVNGLISGLVASGSCAGGLRGQGGTFGPVSGDGTIFFTATHPAFGTGPAGAVSGAHPNYTVGLNDGYGDSDFNDVILAVHIIREPGELTCASPYRGQEVKCTVTGVGVAVTGWTFTGPAYNNPDLILRVTGPTSSNTWKGTAVTSGDVTAQVTVNGSPRSTPLRSSFSVQQRSGDAWSWGPDLHWKFTQGTGKDCGSGTMTYFEGTIVGWNRRTGGCTLGMLTPDPHATSTNGYSVKAASSGPNSGLWYVSALTYQMLRESQINKAIRPNSGLSYTLVDANEKAECSANAGKTITKANFYFFNATCKGLDVAGYVAGIWRHEGYGTTDGSGHQAHFEMAASLVEYSLYQQQEAVYAITQADARTTVVALARAIDDGIRADGGQEGPVDGKNWVGSLFLWAASHLKFIDRLIYT